VYKGVAILGGNHTWYATVTDSWSGSVTTPSYTFYSPEDLFIYDESNGNLITGDTLTVSFFTDNTSSSTTTTDGSVSMVGLPSTQMLISVSGDDWTPRKTILTDQTQNASVYLINASADVIYNQLVVDKNTATYPITQYWIEIQKPVNDSVVTVFASFLDFDGRCGTYFIATDIYKLIIHSPDGTEYSYGWLYPDAIDNLIDISLPFDSGNDYINNWLSDSFTSDEDTLLMTLF